jgi:hypothetical protein
MLGRTLSRYISWAGLFIVGILVCAVIWDWRLFSVALSFTGLLAVALAIIADRAEERNAEMASLDAVHQPDRKATGLRALLKEGISCLFSLLLFLC